MEQYQQPFEEFSPTGELGAFSPLHESPANNFRENDVLGLFAPNSSQPASSSSSSSFESGRGPARTPPPADWTGTQPFSSPSSFSATGGSGSGAAWQSGRYDDEAEEEEEEDSAARAAPFLSQEERAGSSASLEEKRGDYSSGGGHFGPRSSILEASAYEKYLAEKSAALKRQRAVDQRLQEQGRSVDDENEEVVRARLATRLQGITFNPSPSERPPKIQEPSSSPSPSADADRAEKTPLEGEANEISPRYSRETTVLLVKTSVDGGGIAGPAFSEGKDEARKDVSVPLLGSQAPHHPREVDERHLPSSSSSSSRQPGQPIHPGQPRQYGGDERDKAGMGPQSEGRLELGAGVIGGEALRR